MEDENTTAGTPECADVNQDTGKDSVHKDEPNPNNTLGENAMLDDMLNSPIPIRILKNASFPTPTSPDAKNLETPSPPQSQGKNYKILYRETRKRLFEQAELGKKRYDELEELHQELKERYDEDIREKDAKILSLQTTLGRLTESREQENSDNEASIEQFKKVITENEKAITELNEKLAEKNVTGLRRVSSEEEMVRLRPKPTNRKKTNTPASDDHHKCQFEDCDKRDVDLTRCCGCRKWICEACNDISASKFKQLTNKCKRVYFMCKTCAVDMNSSSATAITDNSVIITSLQKMLEKKVTQFEAKIEKVIEKKLGDKMDAVTSLNEKIEKQNESEKDKPSYSKILQVPSEVRKVIQDVKNDEKVELLEQEKRAENFIIHGSDEIGDTNEEVEGNDATYIKDILKKLNVQEEPESITRLGKPNESKRRVMKICMKTKEAKVNVMSNLGFLKGTEEVFGKISVTEDYTVSEREKLREFSAKAKEEEKKDPSRVFKVRGDPKNGLRIISYRRK